MLIKKISKERLKIALDYYRYLLPFAIKNGIAKERNNVKIISVFASPRGGSTWLASLLQDSIPDSAMVWEPLFRHKKYLESRLNPFSYPEFWKLNLWWNQYVPEDENWPELENFFYKLFNQEIVNLRLYRYNNLKQVPKSNTFIYKFVMGNNLLPYITKRFDINPIVLVRHPFATISSQINYGAFEWAKKMPLTVPTWTKFHDHYLPYEEYFKTLVYPEEKLIAQWAMSHKTIFQHKDRNKIWLTVSYEHLLQDSNNELNRIYNYLNIPLPSNIDEIGEKISFTTRKSNDSIENIKNKSQLESWKKRLSAEQISRMLKVLEKFEIEEYGDEIFPANSLFLTEDGLDVRTMK